MVSVVVTVYNGESYIEKALQSIIEQTRKPDEIVVIDDASTDRTRDIILKSFAGKVVYHRNPTNRERCYSRNKGFSLSQGEYVFFMDYDDLWEEHHVETLLRLWGDAQIVYSFPRRLIDATGKVIKRSSRSFPQDPCMAVFSGVVGYPSATAFKRDYFLEYKDAYMVREDWEVFVRACLLGYRIKLVDTDTVMIREHSRRSSKSRRLYEGTKRVYEEYVNRLPEEYLPYFLFHVGDMAMRFGELREGWSLVLKAVAKKPSLLTFGRNLLVLLKRGFRFWR